VNVAKSTINLSEFNDDLTYIGAVVEDTTPQLGGPLDVNGQAITSASNGDVTINPDGTGDISIGADMIPDADATHTIGDEDNRFISIYSDVNGALRFKAKNDEGAQITKGQVVYIKGLAGDGETPTVGLADADDASKMPAFGLAFNTANDQAEIQIVSVGNLYGLNTSAFSVGDTLYVDTTAGGLVNTKPTGETAQLQNIGRVIRSNNGAGVIMVGGAGRSAATPNLDDGKIFLGNASNQAVSTALSAINLTSFNDDLGLATVATTGAYSDLSGTPTLGTAAALDVGTSASNVVQLDGSARLPAVDGSQLTNLPSGATQLNDLSDVTITGASTGEVLRYSGAAWVDATLAYSDLSGTPTLATVATTGAYSDLSGTPTLATVATTGAYSDLSGTPTLGTAAALDVGTSASNVVQLDGSARLPAVDGSQLTNLPTASAASETVAGIIEIATNAEAGAGIATNKALVPSNVSSLSIGSGQVSGLATVATTGAYSDLSGTPTLATVATTGAYSDLSGTPTLGTAAALDVGTSASNVVQLDGSARLPAVDGSQLTNLPTASAASETVAGIIEIATNAEAGAGTATDKALVPSNVSSLSIGSGQVSGLATVATTGAYSDLSGTPTLATVATTGAYSDLSGTPTLGTAAALDVGTSANNVVQLDGSARLPAVDGSQLTNLPGGGGYAISVDTTTIATTSPVTLSSPTDNEEVYVISNGASNVTVNLVAAATCGSGFKYTFKVLGTGTITIDPNSTEYIDHSGQTTYVPAQYDSVTMITDGSNWYLV
jgi:hypothetical protein